MDIKPSERSGRVRVSFSSFDERYRFGASISTLPTAKEAFRWHNYVWNGMFYPDRSYGDPASYPLEVEVRDTTLARAAAGLLRRVDVPNEEVANQSRELLRSIGEYYVALAASQSSLES